LDTICYLCKLKADYLKKYAIDTDCSALEALFAQSLPLDRYENALSFELYTYGRVILGISPTERRKNASSNPSKVVKDRGLRAIYALYTAADSVGLAGDGLQRAFAIAVDKLLDSYVRQNFGNIKPSGRSNRSVLPELHGAISRDFAPFVSRLMALLNGVEPQSYHEDADVLMPDRMLESWQAAALDKIGQIRSIQILDILQTQRKDASVPVLLEDLQVSSQYL